MSAWSGPSKTFSPHTIVQEMYLWNYWDIPSQVVKPNVLNVHSINCHLTKWLGQPEQYRQQGRFSCPSPSNDANLSCVEHWSSSQWTLMIQVVSPHLLFRVDSECKGVKSDGEITGISEGDWIQFNTSTVGPAWWGLFERGVALQRGFWLESSVLQNPFCWYHLRNESNSTLIISSQLITGYILHALWLSCTSTAAKIYSQQCKHACMHVQSVSVQYTNLSWIQCIMIYRLPPFGLNLLHSFPVQHWAERKTETCQQVILCRSAPVQPDLHPALDEEMQGMRRCREWGDAGETKEKVHIWQCPCTWLHLDTWYYVSSPHF